MKRLLIVYFGLSLILQCGWIPQEKALRYPGGKAHELPRFSEETRGGILECRPAEREMFLDNRGPRRCWFSFRPFFETEKALEISNPVVLTALHRSDERPWFWKNPADQGLIDIPLPRSDG